MKPETDAKKLLALLEKKGRCGAKDLGTTGPVMNALVDSGHVRRDGKIHTGKRGKPPIAYVINDGQTPPPEVIEVPKTPSEKERKQAGATPDVIAQAVEEVKAQRTEKSERCDCPFEGIDFLTLKSMPGCRSHWICPVLDKVRRKVGI